MKYLLFLALLICCTACGQALHIQPQPDSTQVVIVTTPYHQSQLDSIPTQPSVLIADPQPPDQLTNDALGTFDRSTIPDLDVSGRYYTRLGECIQNACYVKLWPDNVKIWVSRESIGLSAYVPPTPVPPTSTPIPYCVVLRDRSGDITECGGQWEKEAVEARARQRLIQQLGLPPPLDLNTDRIPVPSDQLCSGCPPTPTPG